MTRFGTNSGCWGRAALGAIFAVIAGQSGCDRLVTSDAPPSVTIVAKGAALRTAPTGEQYYLAADGIRFDGLVSDPDDDIATVELFLNDQAYQQGTPVFESGFHAMRARCIDRAGNESTDFLRFQIKDHVQVAAKAALVSASRYQEEGRRFSRAMIAIELSDGRLEEVDVASIRLMGETEDGLGFRGHVDGAWDKDGRSPTPENADVRIESGRLVIVVSGLPESADPSSFEVIGGGSKPIPFLFWQDVEASDASSKG